MPAALWILLLPLIGSVAAYALRRWRTVEVLIAVGVCALAILTLAQPIDGTLLGLIDLDAQLSVLGRSIQIHPQDRVPLLLLMMCGIVLAAASWRTPENWTFIPGGLVLLTLISFAIMVRPYAFAGLAFAASGALGALMIQAERNGANTTGGATRYLLVCVLAMPMFLGSGYAGQRAAAITDPELIATAYEPASLMLILGFGLMLGAIPVFSWVHPVANDAPPLTTAFLGTVGAGGATFLLLSFMREFPWFANSPNVTGALYASGIACLAMAALLAWAQRSLSRLLACGLLLDIGSTLLTLSISGARGADAVAFAVMSRALSLGLFGIGIALLRERCGSDRFADILGIGSREPWLSLAVGIGGLSMAGLPGTIGFVAQWSSLTLFGGNVELNVLIIVAGISVAIGMLRALSTMFHGVHEPAAIAATRESGERWTVIIGTALVLVLGLLPSVIAPLAQAAGAGYGL
jgi:multicomponent Na+:H+ antiporter subunit D